jgi:multidrug resistance efflux pump
MNPEAIVYAPTGGTVTQRKVGLGQYKLKPYEVT